MRSSEEVWRGDVGEGGGGSHSPASPSFLVINKDNVNAKLWRPWNLLALWDYLEYKGRIGMTHVILRMVNEYRRRRGLKHAG
jgi:hypothetical protein